MRKSAPSSRRPAPVVGASRPPILLQFSAHHTVTAGHVGSLGPKHIGELPVVQLSPTSSAAAEEIYQLYAAPVERLFQLIGGGSGGGGSGANNSNNQRVVVLHCQGLYPNRHWKLGISRILQDVLNVSLVSFQSALHMVPFVLTTPSNPAVFLTVHVSATGAQCMVYASGHTLEYTFQSCGYNDNNIHAGPEEAKAVATVGDLRNLQMRWLSEEDNRSPLLRAILHSLEQCPVQIRKPAIHNLLFAGTVLVDGFGARVAQKLHSFLTREEEDTQSVAVVAPSSREESDEAEETAAQASSSGVAPVVVFTEVPLHRKLLRPLADHIAVVDFGARHYELMPWLGASIWANYWHKHEQENGATAAQLQWVGLVGPAIEA